MVLQDKIVRIRKMHNLNQEEFAEKFCVSRQAVSKWENGNAVPDVNVLTQIADMAGITLDQLVREEYDYPLVQPAEGEPVTQKSVSKEKSFLHKYFQKYRLGDAYEWGKSDSRTPRGALGWTFLHWLLVLVVGAVSFVVQFSFMIDTGESYSGFIFSSDIYMVNPVIYPVGCVLFLVGYYVLWKRYLKPDWKGMAGYRWGWRAGYIVVSLIGLFALFASFVVVLFLYCGLTISLRPEWAMYGMFAFPAYAVLIPIIDLYVGWYKKRGEN